MTSCVFSIFASLHPSSFAFSIFALSLGVIFQIYSTGARSTVLSDEYTRAVIIAQSKLASIGVEGHERIFSVVVLTVMIRVVAHGVSAVPLSKLYGKEAT